MQSACTITHEHTVHLLNILVQGRPQGFRLRGKEKNGKRLGEAKDQASELVLLELFKVWAPASERAPLLQHPQSAVLARGSWELPTGSVSPEAGGKGEISVPAGQCWGSEGWRRGVCGCWERNRAVTVVLFQLLMTW